MYYPVGRGGRYAAQPPSRPVEIPTAIYDVLAERARQEGRPVTGIVVDLVIDGLDAQEGYGRLAGEIVELQRAVAALQRALEALENCVPP